jgi:hypothetical protein
MGRRLLAVATLMGAFLAAHSACSSSSHDVQGDASTPDPPFDASGDAVDDTSARDATLDVGNAPDAAEAGSQCLALHAVCDPDAGAPACCGQTECDPLSSSPQCCVPNDGKAPCTSSADCCLSPVVPGQCVKLDGSVGTCRVFAT